MQSITPPHSEHNPQFVEARLTRAGVTCAATDFVCSAGSMPLRTASSSRPTDSMLFASSGDSRLRFRKPMRVVFTVDGSSVRADALEVGHNGMGATRSEAIARLRSALAADFTSLSADPPASGTAARERFARLSEFLELRPRGQAMAHGS